ncbi:MAG: hypothetical protein IJ409_11085 [Lachnospiraceae bacterium]|nr:hypothetical protein [Lachnospiraceae bacterium]
MMKKFRKLLALAIVVTLLAGSSITVFAQEGGTMAEQPPAVEMPTIYTYNPSTLEIERNDFGVDGLITLVPVTEISGGGQLWFVYGVDLHVNGTKIDAYDNGNYYEYTLPESGIWSVNVANIEDGTICILLREISADGIGSSESAPVMEHTHDFEWRITVDPTDEADGLSENVCKYCAARNGSQPVSKAFVWVKNIVERIENAPEGGTVVVESDTYFCYTAKIMEALLANPDVSLETHFTDAEGNAKKFTIPAGQAPTDGAQFYGFTGLGNTYGWQ